MKLWLDDKRPMPPEYDEHVLTAQDAIESIVMFHVTDISLDHDLGDGAGTGYDVAKFIETSAHDGMIGRIRWKLHTANQVGRERMRMALANADRFWDEMGLR